MNARAARQIGPLPVMAGEQQNLTILTLLEQPLQRSGQPLVIEGGEHVIQDQGAATTGSMLSSVKPRSSMVWMSFKKSGLAWVKVPRI